MKRAILLLLSLAGVVIVLAPGRGAPVAQVVAGPPARSTFLVIYRPGPAWVHGKPIRQQPPKEHGKYLIGLYERGFMKFAGPFDDDTGAAVVLEAASAAEAVAIVAEDPAVKAGIFAHEIHPWSPVPWEKYVKRPSTR